MTEGIKKLLSFALGLLVAFWAITVTESERLTEAINYIYSILSN